MRFHVSVHLLLFTLFTCATAAGAGTGSLVVDLSKLKAGETNTLSIGSGTWQAKVTSKIPGKAYTVSTRVYTKLLPALDSNLLKVTAAQDVIPATDCRPLQTAAAALQTADSEAKAPALRAALSTALAVFSQHVVH
jgi:hypothetical protein